MSASRLRTGRTSIWLPGRNAADADVDRQAALDAFDDAADDDLLVGVGLLDLVPDLHLLRFFAGEDDVAFAIFRAFQQDVDDVADLHGHLPVLVEEFVDGNDALRLESDVDDDLRFRDLEHRALDDLAFRDVAEAVIVKVQQPRILLRVALVLVVPGHLDGVFRAGRRASGVGGFGHRGLRLVFNIRHAVQVLLDRSIAGLGSGAGARGIAFRRQETHAKAGAPEFR